MQHIRSLPEHIAQGGDIDHPPQSHPQVPATPGAVWSAQRILCADRDYVWHPYAPRAVPNTGSPHIHPPVPVASTSGVNLHLADGRTVIDGMSSWWAACHGHGHPHLRNAAHQQIETMSHVMFGGLTHQPAAQLAERLVHWCNRAASTEASLNGAPLAAVFFSDSGSVALKMALQYQRGIGNSHRNRFLTWRGGYHGDTQGPMSVCDPDGGMHALWEGTLTKQHFVAAPPTWGTTVEVREIYLTQLRKELISAGNIAAVIVEPIVQGAGGMRFHDPGLIAGLRRICDETDTVLILDEIATGFGRTGQSLACHAAGILPDILCLGKALTGGFMSFAATLTNHRVAQVIDSGPGGGALMHGPTFMGNPLACAVASASLDLIESDYWRTTVPCIETRLCALEELRGQPGVADIRVLGAIGVVELTTEVPMGVATRALLENGVWLHPFGRLLYTMPPFVSTEDEVDKIVIAMKRTVGALA